MLTDACASCTPYLGGYAHWGMLQVRLCCDLILTHAGIVANASCCALKLLLPVLQTATCSIEAQLKSCRLHM
jgi:hypothetical protein